MWSARLVACRPVYSTGQHVVVGGPRELERRAAKLEGSAAPLHEGGQVQLQRSAKR